MYLSRLILNPRHRRVQREVADAYQMHRSLMQAFPDDLKKEDERVLFRLETDGRSGGLVLLVQSWTLPDWSWLAEPGSRGYLLPVDEPNPGVKAFDVELATGQVLAFRLRANPTVMRRFESGDHKRVGLHGEEEQRAWLERKGDHGGFRVDAVRTSHQEEVHARIARGGDTHRVKMLAVQFDGLLQVADADRMAHALSHGIGSGKGLGFGLLSLARSPS
jgi:CRISPR system Cascade subunit CasE